MPKVGCAYTFFGLLLLYGHSFSSTVFSCIHNIQNARMTDERKVIHVQKRSCDCSTDSRIYSDFQLNGIHRKKIKSL
ncbi:hypothetical protein NSTC745_00277 [Nostoc sp. DSM 114161]|jgi:hypothetical protein